MKTKIFIAIDQFGTLGGISSVNDILNSGLSHKGYDVNYISLTNTSNTPNIVAFDRLKKFTSKNRLARMHPGPFKAKLAVKKIMVPVWKLDASYRILKFILSCPNNSCIIFSTTNIAQRILCNRISNSLLKLKKITTFYQFHNSFDSPYANDAVVKIGKKSSMFIALCPSDATRFSQQIGPHVISIDNPCPAYEEPDNYLNRPKIVSVISRMSPEKNIPAIIDAFNAISLSNSEWKLEIYGGGEMSDYIKKYIRNLNNPRIKFGGVLSSEEVVNQLKRSRLIAMASEFEGMPMSMLEAAAAGTPSISNVSSAAVKTFIDKSHGFLVEPNSREQYSRILSVALSEISISDRRSKLARNYARENSLEKFIDSWVYLLENVKP